MNGPDKKWMGQLTLALIFYFDKFKKIHFLSDRTRTSVSRPLFLRAAVHLYSIVLIIISIFLDSECSQKSKAKRVRTTFTEDQLQVLQANFQLDSNPDGQDLERIAQITGLSKRVTQVWFQNSRARQKKQQQGGEHTSPSSNSSPSKPHSKCPYHQTLTFIHYDTCK